MKKQNTLKLEQQLRKESKKAADQAIFNAETNKRLLEQGKAQQAAKKAAEKQQSNKGGINVSELNIASIVETAMVNVMNQYRERELHMQIRLQEARNEEIKARQSRMAVEQDTIAFLQSFEQRMMQMEQRISDKVLELEILNRKVELAKLQLATASAPVEFELTPMIPATHGKLEEVVEEHTTAVETILDAITVTEEKPKKKKRVGRPKGSKNKNKVEEVETVNPDLNKLREMVVIKEPVIGRDYYPVRKGRSGYSIAWKQVIEENCFMVVVRDVVEFALEYGVDIKDTTAFREFHPVCQGAYVQYIKANPGKGSWKELIKYLGL